ncbi:hypothetical protein [Actinocorallia libanotica]|uniref:Neocarzinostatin family protein n=1 Tax=Actinocorallia libanotica TaxID=46162 RepID=A0ABN1R2L5_9ACTN
MRRAPLLLLPALLAGVAATGTAYAEGASAKGAQGQTLTVSSASLSDGDTITVTGSGFDETKGVYVALCRDPGPGRPATPCGGGADTSGTGGGSQWVSSNPPPYGRELAIAYGEGGTFEVKLAATRKIGDFDCAEVECSVVTRADHTRGSDRSQDVRVPVEFGGSGDGPLVIGGSVAAAVVVLGAGGLLLARRRKAAA